MANSEESDNDTIIPPNWEYGASLDAENPTEKDIKLAYEILDAQDTSITDELLIEIYRIRVFFVDIFPRQRKALAVIGKAKRSPIISRFLATEEGFQKVDYSSRM
ncbi:2399_t:CDS:2 [Ambispora gerdemannii]|uniref:2399_t:CDS:1 n=1 Tax=Ambispora gerdemannii TaxID=144530 RepID=A0A9N9AEW6_9GLOM|nr:2399_t:CDS:2 [Ambispora gerdemannii]